MCDQCFSTPALCYDNDYSVAEIRGFLDITSPYAPCQFTSPDGGTIQSMAFEEIEQLLCQGNGRTYLLAALKNEFTGLGHMVLVSGTDTSGGPLYATVDFMDPDPSQQRWIRDYSLASFVATGGPPAYGPWLRFVGVTEFLGPPNSVADIHDFRASATGHNVQLSYELSNNLQQQNAVYVSDNQYGPALLVPALGCTSGLATGTCTDILRRHVLLLA